MSETSIAEYLRIQKIRYHRRPCREARSALLDECVEFTGRSRKHLIKVLGGRLPVQGGSEAVTASTGSGADPPSATAARRGRPALYTGLVPVIKALWLASEQPCGKRLRAVLTDWLPHWEKRHGALSADQRRLLKRVSPAQLDRLLAPHRAAHGKKHRRPPGDSALKAQVPLRSGPWEVSGPGWTEPTAGR